MRANEKPDKLTRAYQIKEEARLAAEFGQSPRTPVSVARNFRVEGLTRTALTPPTTCIQSSLVMKVAPNTAPRLGNPYRSMASPGVLLATIEDLLKRLNHGTRVQLVPILLEHYGDFAAQAHDADQLKALQKRVLTAAFGEQYFKHIKGGSAKDHCGNFGQTANLKKGGY